MLTVTCLSRELIERTGAARESQEGEGRSPSVSCPDKCRKGLMGRERPLIEVTKSPHKLYHLLLFIELSPHICPDL